MILQAIDCRPYCFIISHRYVDGNYVETCFPAVLLLSAFYDKQAVIVTASLFQYELRDRIPLWYKESLLCLLSPAPNCNLILHAWNMKLCDKETILTLTSEAACWKDGYLIRYWFLTNLSCSEWENGKLSWSCMMHCAFMIGYELLKWIGLKWMVFRKVLYFWKIV